MVVKETDAGGSQLGRGQGGPAPRSLSPCGRVGRGPRYLLTVEMGLW